MYLRRTPNLLHFHPDLDAPYALRRTPNFYEIHPRLCNEQYAPLAKIPLRFDRDILQQ
jgi:hypothetical protein